MLDQTHAESDVGTAVGRILGTPLIAAQPATGGGNNRVYRAETADGVYAIKFYPRQEADLRDRLGQEFASLTLMSKHNIGCVPHAYGYDESLNCAAYEWVDGTMTGAVSAADIDAMIGFARALAELNDDPGAAAIMPASASCFAAADGVNQFAERLSRLRAASDDGVLHTFLDERLAPAFEIFVRRACDNYDSRGMDFNAPLQRAQRTLSPSDFGFHNAIRRSDGTLVFLDFEYFGWDDPVKMISDAIWHPGSAMEDGAAIHFRRALLDFFTARDGDTLRTRYNALCPLFGMIWCLIILNEFLPERWARRVAAGSTEDALDARARQLDAAQALFTRVTEQPYD